MYTLTEGDADRSFSETKYGAHCFYGPAHLFRINGLGKEEEKVVLRNVETNIVFLG